MSDKWLRIFVSVFLCVAFTSILYVVVFVDASRFYTCIGESRLIDVNPIATTDYRTVSEYVYLEFENGMVIKETGGNLYMLDASYSIYLHKVSKNYKVELKEE